MNNLPITYVFLWQMQERGKKNSKKEQATILEKSKKWKVEGGKWKMGESGGK